MNNQEQLEQLIRQLTNIQNQQHQLQSQIDAIKGAIVNLQQSQSTQSSPTQPVLEKEMPIPKKVPPTVTKKPAKKREPTFSFDVGNNLEKFIGENLISKIGILILVIGVGLGAKYAIDNELISPLGRVIAGYLIGGVLLGFAIRLRAKFKNYSAVLLSGAMAIFYFLTYFAATYYGFIPIGVAFALMVFFTVFTVLAAINYDQPIIAHLGLVGAYGVPFLLGDENGDARVLFLYIGLLNIGVLAISFLRNWRSLFVLSFIFSWLIFSSWIFWDYRYPEDWYTATLTIFGFFLIFYGTALAYKLVKKEAFKIGNVWLILANAFLFYGYGFGLIGEIEFGSNYLGLFTLGNAILHFGVSLFIARQKLGDKSLLYLVIALVLIFLTMTIPVQLEGNWVTILWAAEALVLFWIGRSLAIRFYERMSYFLMGLAFVSLLILWASNYGGYYGAARQNFNPIINQYWLTGVLFTAAFSMIWWLSMRYPSQKKGSFFRLAVPTILLFSYYFLFQNEIAHFWDIQYYESNLSASGEIISGKNKNQDLFWFKSIWLNYYNLFFWIVLGILNLFWFRNKVLGKINLAGLGIGLLIFLIGGLPFLNNLQNSYLEIGNTENYPVSWLHIGIRYIGYALVAGTFLVINRYLQDETFDKRFKIGFDLILHLTIVWILSNEVINGLQVFGIQTDQELELSIFWGIYSVFMIVLGIWQKKNHLRIAAIALLAVTLLKLFFYDLTELNAIAKTIVFVSLGVLLLLISFLYNKYKIAIFNEESSE